MTTPIYSIQNGSLSFASQEIFQDLDLFLYPNDKVCLIGKNGCGKSSLMKIITGIYELDDGKLYKAPGMRVNYLPQDAKAKFKSDIYNFVLQQIPDSEKEEKKYLADIILNNLQLDGNLMMSNLSGGQVRRAFLAEALLTEPEILLLDEPTNHLDISAIEWLEEYIRSYKGAVVCISHDRRFLHNVTNKLWWLDRKTLKKSDKGFAYFDEWQEEILAQEMHELERLNRQVEEGNLWLQQGVTARRKRNMRRLNEVYALRDRLKQEQSSQNARKNKISLENIENNKKTKFIIEANNICFSYNNKPLIKNFNLNIKRGEKIGLIGPNGAGKSTIIKLLIKQLPTESGTVKHGVGLDISYFDQHKQLLNPEQSLWQNMCPGGGADVFFADGRSMHVAAYLKKFMFDPQILNDKVTTLSGGQQSRLMLAKILVNPGNFLILDEPTNDLDMDSLEVLYNILMDFNGTILLVSHDRDFLDRLVTKTLVFNSRGEIETVIGGYQDIARHLSQAKISEGIKKTVGAKEATQSIVQENISIQKPKLSYKYQRLIEVLPQEIADHEQRLEGIEEQLSDMELFNKSPEKFHKLSQELLRLQNTIAEKEALWLNLTLEN